VHGGSMLLSRQRRGIGRSGATGPLERRVFSASETAVLDRKCVSAEFADLILHCRFRSNTPAT